MAQQWKFETPNGSIKVSPSTGRVMFTYNPETNETSALFAYSATHIDPTGKRTKAVIRQEALDELRVRFPQVRSITLASDE